MRQRTTSQSLIAAVATALAATAWAATPPKGTVPAAPAASAVMSDPHAAHPSAMPVAKPKAKSPAAPVKLVDINSAGKAELKTLPGIGDAEAENIIKNRPYLTKADLVGKGVLGEGPYLSLRRHVIAFQKGRTKVVKQPPSNSPPARAASAPTKKP